MQKVHTMNRQVLFVASILALALTAALADSTPTGSLTVRLNAPTGVAPRVTVSGPGGFSATITATTTLPNLTLGTYLITAPTHRQPGEIVDELFDATLSSSGARSVVVTDKAALNTEVTFVRRGGTGMMWLTGCAMGDPRVHGYNSPELRSSGGLKAVTTLTVNKPGRGGCPGATVFDASGNLWVSDFDQEKILMYPPASLTVSGVPTPSVVLSNPRDDPSLSDPKSFRKANGLAFDPNGNLWVLSRYYKKIIKFTAAQIVRSGEPLPSVVLTQTTVDGLLTLESVHALAFDASGNLWVVNATQNIVMFAAADLNRSAALKPALRIVPFRTDGANNLRFVEDLAFDSSGNLWVSNTDIEPDRNRVLKYEVSALQPGVNAVVPAATLNMPARVRPKSLAFDNAGSLWVDADVGDGKRQLLKFANPNSFKGILTPSVKTTLKDALGYSGGRFAFNPTPTNLPIYQQR
jgi:sugar lactone lactonase YvrE